MLCMDSIFNKIKLAAGNIPNNKDEMVGGYLQVHEDPPHQEPPSNPLQYSTAVEHEIAEGRDAPLKRVFNDVPGMASKDKGLLGNLFENFGSASTTSHSPLLQKKASHAPPHTLAEELRRLK